jgi:hypothetical protein
VEHADAVDEAGRAARTHDDVEKVPVAVVDQVIVPAGGDVVPPDESVTVAVHVAEDGSVTGPPHATVVVVPRRATSTVRSSWLARCVAVPV